VIRFVAAGGKALGLGLSFANLDLLAKQQPIVFDLLPYGRSGRMILLAGGESDVAAALRAASGSDRVIGLTPRTLASLRGGNFVDVQHPELDLMVFLFAARDERAVIGLMRETGMIGRETPLDWTGYELHERGQAADCAKCEEPPLPWWKPALVVVGLTVLAVILGLFLAPAAGAR
jgi:hypothetical protein